MSTSSHSRLALDLDGTLVDPRARQVRVMREVAAEAGARLDKARFWELKRGGRTSNEALLELGYALSIAERWAVRWGELIEQPRYLALDRLLPGIEAALDRLAADGERPLILTARRREEAAWDEVRALGLLRWCSHVCVVSPSAAAQEKALELRSRGCRAFIGDTESDARAAEIAGVEFAAVSTGQRSAEFLSRRGLRPFSSLAAALRELEISTPGIA